MLANVQQATIKPVIEATVAKGSLIYTDEYNVYARLPAWGYLHKTVCHGQGEYARDEDGDGFVRSTSTRWKASGLCCARGCVRTGAFRRRSCRIILASFNSCTMRVAAQSTAPRAHCRSGHVTQPITLKSDKSQKSYKDQF
jgi:hypothetical protein